MSNAKIQAFDFDDVPEGGFLSVADFLENEKVTVTSDKDGKILEKKTLESNKDGEIESFDVYLLSIKRKDSEEKMKISTREVRKLRQICKGNVGELEGKTFIVSFQGAGTFRNIALVLAS